MQFQHLGVVLELSPEHLRAIRSHAEHTYPHECCGLLLGRLSGSPIVTKTVTEVRETDNAWNSEQTAFVPGGSELGEAYHYAIAPNVLLTAQRQARDRNLAIIGIYHSHPDHLAIPSPFDQEFAWPQYSYMIVSVQSGRSAELQCWMLDHDHRFQPEAIAVTAANP